MRDALVIGAYVLEKHRECVKDALVIRVHVLEKHRECMKDAHVVRGQVRELLIKRPRRRRQRDGVKCVL